MPERRPPRLTEAQQATVMLGALGHVEALIDRADCPACEHAALELAREAIRHTGAFVPDLRRPRDLGQARTELRLAMRELQALGATWQGLPDARRTYDQWIAWAVERDTPTAPRPQPPTSDPQPSSPPRQGRGPQPRQSAPLTAPDINPVGRRSTDHSPATGLPTPSGPVAKGTARHAGTAPQTRRQRNTPSGARSPQGGGVRDPEGASPAPRDETPWNPEEPAPAGERAQPKEVNP